MTAARTAAAPTSPDFVMAVFSEMECLETNSPPRAMFRIRLAPLSNQCEAPTRLFLGVGRANDANAGHRLPRRGGQFARLSGFRRESRRAAAGRAGVSRGVGSRRFRDGACAHAGGAW